MTTERPPESPFVLHQARSASFWDALGTRLPLLLMGGIPMLFAHTIGLQRLPHIPCWFLHITGLPCPFCGYTRSFQAMADGDFLFAFTNCPPACALYVLCGLMLVWNGVAILSGRRLEMGGRLGLPFKKSAWLTTVILVLANWAYRLALGFK